MKPEVLIGVNEFCFLTRTSRSLFSRVFNADVNPAFCRFVTGLPSNTAIALLTAPQVVLVTAAVSS